MPRGREPVFDEDNPEWTEADFARAQLPEEVLPPEIARQFARRGPQVAPTKVPISIRLSRDVLDRLRAEGAGWQSRVDEILRKHLGL
jgi:uncharacterized protein (DUF4415 family)